MPQITISATLAKEEMPLLARRIREPVLVGKYDINYGKHVEDNKQQKPAETTVPMLAYADNVLATYYGYKSVTFTSLLARISATAEVIFADSISSTSLGSFIYAYVEDSVVPDNTGHWIVTQDIDGVLTWEQLLEVTAYDPGTLITVAAINSRIFIHVANTITYEFDGSALASVSLGGLTTADIVGIVATSGYLVAYSSEKPFWSSLTNPLDFIPSDITGAGSSSVQELQGDIVLCRAAESGFIMYSTVNAVYALASADIRFPFIFKEIKGIGGIANSAAVSYGQSQTHMVRSGAGLSKVSKSGVTAVMNDVNSFINGTLSNSIDADFDIEEVYVGPIEAQLLHTRHGEAVVSYGIEGEANFTGLIYYASNLNRYSKLAVSHSFVLENPFTTVVASNVMHYFGTSLYEDYPEPVTYESLAVSSVRSTTDTGIVLLRADGELVFLDGRYELSYDGAIILGPFQLIREQTSTLVAVNIQAASTSKVTVTIKSTASDGSVRTVVPDGRQINKGIRYDTRVTGLNHLVCITGSFDLSSVTLTFAPHSSRR